MAGPYTESVAKGAGAGGKGGQLVAAATLRIHEPVLRGRELLGGCRCRQMPPRDRQARAAPDSTRVGSSRSRASLIGPFSWMADLFWPEK